jgi:shikimate kinase
MGAGKSTIGKCLGAKLNLQFVDLDVLIEEREGQSIPSLFSERGEKYFRELEHKYLLGLVNDKHV